MRPYCPSSHFDLQNLFSELHPLILAIPIPLLSLNLKVHTGTVALSHILSHECGEEGKPRTKSVQKSAWACSRCLLIDCMTEHGGLGREVKTQDFQSNTPTIPEVFLP